MKRYGVLSSRNPDGIAEKCEVFLLFGPRAVVFMRPQAAALNRRVMQTAARSTDVLKYCSFEISTF